MKIAVIGASGRSGRAFVRAALENGHSVRAGARRASSMRSHSALTIVECDATNPGEVRELLDGQDAVVSLLGHVKGSAPDVQTRAIQTAITVMGELKLTRLVSLTGTGVRFNGDHITLIDRILNTAISVIDPARVRDGQAHVELLKDSQLRWTVIRVLKLQPGLAQPYRLSLHGPTKTLVTREEVAQAILEVLESESFLRQAPMISPATQKGKAPSR